VGLNLVDLLHEVRVLDHPPDLDRSRQPRITHAREEGSTVPVYCYLRELNEGFRVNLSGFIVVVVDLAIVAHRQHIVVGR